MNFHPISIREIYGSHKNRKNKSFFISHRNISLYTATYTDTRL